MGVYVCNGEIKIEKEGRDTERELLWATLLTDEHHLQELQRKYLGFALDDGDRQPLTEREQHVVADEVLLMMHAAKHSEQPDGYYHVPVPEDMLQVQVPIFLGRAGIQARDERGLAY